MKSLLVSGYVPLGEGHRSHEEYMCLGEHLVALPAPKLIYRHSLECCWMYGAVKDKGYEPRTGGDEKKDTMNYHIVQHQKTTWMLQAAATNPDHDVFVWMDYGIFHQPGFTQAGVVELLRNCADEKDIAIPGSWPKGQNGGPCWRFNGSILICHRRWLAQLDHAIRVAAMTHAALTGTVIWEVNTWDMVETYSHLPIRWYGATHNGTMLTAYRKADQ